MDTLVGMKEMSDITIRTNQPISFGGKKFEINETILSFERAEIAQVQENKRHTQATGGFNNNLLIEWESDRDVSFALTHGILSPSSYALLSNSSLNKKDKISVPFKEELQVIEDYDETFYVLLKYIPNCDNYQYGLQGNPENEPLPMGRKEWIDLKPLPPSKNNFIFCYDSETGQRIKKFKIQGNKIIFYREHRKVMIDYTFDYTDSILNIEVGNQLIKGDLNLTGKIVTKEYKTGKQELAILQIPRLKINSNLSFRVGSAQESATVSDFYFTGYPAETGLNRKVFDIYFLSDFFE